MNKIKADNVCGTYLKVRQIADECNIGEATVRKIAAEAGAVRRIGRCYRINKEKFLDFIENRQEREA